MIFYLKVLLRVNWHSARVWAETLLILFQFIWWDLTFMWCYASFFIWFLVSLGFAQILLMHPFKINSKDSIWIHKYLMKSYEVHIHIRCTYRFIFLYNFLQNFTKRSYKYAFIIKNLYKGAKRSCVINHTL